jgi:hypothetical protein
MFSKLSPRSLPCFGLAAMVWLVAGSSPAHAGKRVAMLGFEGAIAARAVVSRMLRAEHQVVPRRTVIEEVRKLRIGTGCDPTTIPGVASVVGAEGVVCGDIDHGRLVLRVLNGGDGAVVATIKMRIGPRGISSAARARAQRTLYAALGKTWSWAAVEVQKTAAEAPARRMSSVNRDLTAAVPESHGAWENDDSENPLAQTRRPSTKRSVSTAAVRSRPTEPRRGVGEHAVRLGLGPAFLLRRNYGVSDATAPRDAQGWTTTPVAGFALDAELFPAAWLTRGWAAHIGLGLSYSRYFGLTWRTAGEEEQRAATHQVFDIDLRGRAPIALGERQLVVGAHFGYRYLSFAMNDGQTPAVVPDVAFGSLDLGLTAEITILPRWLSASACFSYLPVLSRGEIVTNEEYGSGGGGGMIFGGGVSGPISGPVGWRLEAEYTRYTVAFDWDPAAARHADKARDRYLTGLLYLTYVN